jgi:hypothetical protein
MGRSDVRLKMMGVIKKRPLPVEKRVLIFCNFKCVTEFWDYI